MVIEVDYENATVSCRSCGHVNILNRATDLAGIDFIAGVERPCETCAKPVRIPLENANPPYELFVFEAKQQRAVKRYMRAAGTLAQAFEMFFALVIDVIVLHHPWNAADETDEAATGLRDALYEVTEEYTYRRMRNVMINLALRDRPQTFETAHRVVQEIPAMTKDLSNESIMSGAEPRLAALLLELKRLPVDSLRNRVIHKRAHRPTLEELDQCLEPAPRLLSDIWIALRLSDSLHSK